MLLVAVWKPEFPSCLVLWGYQLCLLVGDCLLLINFFQEGLFYASVRHVTSRELYFGCNFSRSHKWTSVLLFGVAQISLDYSEEVYPRVFTAGIKLPFLQSTASMGGLGTPNSICSNDTLTAWGAAVRQ